MTATVDDSFYRPDNPFMDRLIDTVYRHRGHKRQRSACHSKDSIPDAMPLFATTHSRQHLAPPSNLVRKRSDRNLASRHDVDDYLTSDELEVSFASNVSLNSPPRRSSGLPDCEPMDISPMPPPKSKGTSGLKGAGRPRALTSNNSRLFGSDLSNGSNPAHLTSKSTGGTEPKKAGTTTNRKLARSALPTEWMAAMLPPQPEPDQAPTQPSSPTDDAMDVDTSYIMEAPPAIAAVDFSSPVQPAPPGQDGFTNLFYDTMSPPRRSLDGSKGGSKKQRSLSPEGSPAMVNDATSSPAPPSPSLEKFDRMAAAGRSSKPGLQGLGAPSVSFLRRPRRPVLSEVVITSGQEIQSAYPIPSAGLQPEGSGPGGLPVRRAFSALLPPSAFTMDSEGDSSFDAEDPDMSSPAQAYHKRQQGKTIRRRDGTEDFRPLTGASVAAVRPSPSSRIRSPGLPGFGDNEAHGKILPCHRVSEDGLMRITPRTLNELLDGKFDHAINDFHVIDCRFDYEYAGGHIKNAVNINTTAAIEELLLGPSLTKPRPSTSGDNTRKTVLVFHCEFSAKRAPTFAKHLRAKDRAMNNHTYPKIHYPEVYILEGGYCNYFKVSGHRCDPPNYVTMDDPNHATARREDLDQFRKAKFGRHKSYAYGDMAAASQQGQSRRNTAPTSLFAAAASAVRARRAGSISLGTLQEDANTTVEHERDDTDTELGDSPCPPPTRAPLLKSKKPLRSLVRSETYNPATRLAF